MQLGARLRNWGRWGPDDERGTLNLITPERLVAAARLVREGKIFDLGIPFDENGPQPGGGRINPVHLMSQTGDTQVFPGGFKYADDYIFMPLQGATQWDSLAHVYYDDQIYNGLPVQRRHRRRRVPLHASTRSPRASPGAASCSTSPA